MNPVFLLLPAEIQTEIIRMKASKTNVIDPASSQEWNFGAKMISTLPPK